ncbi:MAG: glycosyltransferase family 39 protein [Coleofasciculaceae cyanobacterium]
MAQSRQDSRLKILLMLGAIWLLTTACDRLWFGLDHSVPPWDQADYLTGSLNYWQALQQPQWFSGEWWKDFWQISSKIPPLFYIVTAIIQQLVGTGPDQATLVLPLFSAILIISVYGLGRQLFNSRVGLWAALLCVILPGLYRYRLEFLLDYPLTVAVTFSFFCLTVWRNGELGVGRDGEDGEDGEDKLTSSPSSPPHLLTSSPPHPLTSSASIFPQTRGT